MDKPRRDVFSALVISATVGKITADFIEHYVHICHCPVVEDAHAVTIPQKRGALETGSANGISTKNGRLASKKCEPPSERNLLSTKYPLSPALNVANRCWAHQLAALLRGRRAALRARRGRRRSRPTVDDRLSAADVCGRGVGIDGDRHPPVAPTVRGCGLRPADGVDDALTGVAPPVCAASGKRRSLKRRRSLYPDGHLS